MKKGKEPMRTFGDLMQFFGAKTDDKKPPAPNKQEQGEKRGPAAADAPPAEAATAPAMPVDGNVVDANSRIAAARDTAFARSRRNP